jgi:hypothetical protein
LAQGLQVLLHRQPGCDLSCVLGPHCDIIVVVINIHLSSETGIHIFDCR